MNFFNDSGRKIQLIAIVTAIVECIASFVGAIALWQEHLVGFGFLVLFLGPCFAWLSNILIYGFGSLIISAEMTEIYQESSFTTLRDINKHLVTLLKPTKSSSPNTSTKKIATQPKNIVPVSKATTTEASTSTTNNAPAKKQSTPKPMQIPEEEEEKFYLYAVQMFQYHSYDIAYNIFSKIPHYKDSSEYLEKLKTLL